MKPMKINILFTQTNYLVYETQKYKIFCAFLSKNGFHLKHLQHGQVFGFVQLGLLLLKCFNKNRYSLCSSCFYFLLRHKPNKREILHFA